MFVLVSTIALNITLLCTAAVRVPANQSANVVRAQADSQNPDTWPNTSDVAAELKSVPRSSLANPEAGGGTTLTDALTSAFQAETASARVAAR